MLYLIDANVLIDAHRDYYPIDRVPDFWDWLLTRAGEERLKIPQEIYEEVIDGKHDLVDWLRDNRATMVLDESVKPELVTRVVERGYAPDLTDVETEKMGRDPFLIAYALAAPASRCVVTAEVSKPSRSRANRHIPDVCSDFGIRSINTFRLIRELDFRIGGV